MKILRNRCNLNETLEKMSQNDRIIADFNATVNVIEEKLKNFDKELQNVRTKMEYNYRAVCCQFC